MLNLVLPGVALARPWRAGATTWLALRPSLIIRSTELRTSSRSGTSRSSQRRHASPLVTTAARGWLTSCAIEAVSSPERRHARHVRKLGLRLVQRIFRATPILDVGVDPVPAQIRPFSSRNGAARARSQRYSPSADRTRHTASKAPLSRATSTIRLRAAGHRQDAQQIAIGSLAASAAVQPRSDQCALTRTIDPSAADALHTMPGIVSIACRNSCSA